MEKLQLFVGDKHLSSWSMRPWLLMKHFEIPFEEHLVRLDQSDTKEKLALLSPNALVPLLVDGATKVWDSFAICEYLAEKHSQLNLWPDSTRDRAWARSICCEMHSGFQELRKECGMKLLDFTKDKKSLTPEVEKDLRRIDKIWHECRESSKARGPYLFGAFTIADAYFLPVVSRIRSYDLQLKNTNSQAYYNYMISCPLFHNWLDEAKAAL